MAGYMTKMFGNVYEGELTNGAAAAVENGVLMVMGSDGKTLVLPEADTTSKFVAKEKTTLYDGIPAVRFVAQQLDKVYYLVENNFDINTSEAYDTTKYVTAKGKYLRAHPVLVGEELCVTTTANVTEGTTYGVLATGMIG